MSSVQCLNCIVSSCLSGRFGAASCVGAIFDFWWPVVHARATHIEWKRLMNIFDLSGRVAVITGGNGGIGLGIAQALASSGCNVSIWGRNADKNKAAAATMASGPGKI